MTEKAVDAHQFLLRLPKPLHRRLLAQAKRNNVSLNTEIVNQLEGYDAKLVEMVQRAVQAAVPMTLEQLFEKMERRGAVGIELPGFTIMKHSKTPDEK
jgi:hypothetical protein